MKKILALIFMVALAFAFTACSDDSDSNAYVRLTNETNYTMSNISAAGVTWVGPYYDGDTTEQKEVSTGQTTISWTCGGSSYSLVKEIEEGYWRLIMYNCSGTSTTVVEE